MKKRGKLDLLGRDNHLALSTDKEKFWNFGLEAEEITPFWQRVWTCNYGFLLISREPQDNRSCKSYEFYIWKPESSELINLPPLNNLKPEQEIKAATLFSHPGKPGSMVILFEGYLRYIIYYRYGDKQWNTRWIGKEISDLVAHSHCSEMIYTQSITYCNGILYAATYSNNYLMVIEENRAKNLKLRGLNCTLPSPFSPSGYNDRYLLDFRGQLCFVYVYFDGVDDGDIIDFDVFKLESTENMMKWVRMKSIEGGAFFLSSNYAFFCPAKEPEIQENHIYLNRRNRLYSINIKDKSLSASLSLQNLSGLEKPPFMTMQDLIRLCNLQVKPEHPMNTLEVQKEKRLIEDDNETNANNLCELPYDVLGFIAKRLYLIDYINYRSICHNFRLAAPRIKWSESPFKSQFPSLSPWLVFSDSCAATYNFIDSHFGERYLINIPECLLHGKIRYSHDGWMLICSSSSMFFYQPFTKELIELPQGVGREQQNCCVGYALSSSPTTTDSILVGITLDCLYYFCRSEGQWIELLDFHDSIPNHNSSIYFDGAFYFLGMDGQVTIFELNNGQVSCKTLLELQSPCSDFSYNYLLECGGKLLSVFVVDQFVYLYKLNFGTIMTWEKVTNLRNYALFVSPASSFSMIANSAHMKNKVYFFKLYGMDIIYYCLTTDKFYDCRNKKVVPDIMNTTEFMLSTWIKPSWQFVPPTFVDVVEQGIEADELGGET